MKLLVLFILIFADFLSKKIVFNFVDLNNMISVLFFFDITHIHNFGISFGLFSGILPVWFIVLLGIAMIIILIIWIIRSSNVIEKWGILLILAGAISNIGDRMLNNYVLDFIFLHYKQYYWPAFNFADIYITIGVLLIIIESYKVYKNKYNKNEEI